MSMFKLGLLSIMMSFVVANPAFAEKQICKDLKSINEWDLKLNFAKINGGNEGLIELSRSQEYQTAYQSYYRLIRSMKLANENSTNHNLVRTLKNCIENTPDNHPNRPRKVPSVMGYDLSTPFNSEIYSRELLAQIESNSQFRQSLTSSVGKEHFDNLVGYLKSSKFDETTFLNLLDAISIGSTVVAVILVLSFISAVISGGLAAMFIIPVLFVGALGVTFADNAYVSFNSMRASYLDHTMDDKLKDKLSNESAQMAGLIIQNSVKSKLSQETNSVLKSLP